MSSLRCGSPSRTAKVPSWYCICYRFPSQYTALRATTALQTLSSPCYVLALSWTARPGGEVHSHWTALSDSSSLSHFFRDFCKCCHCLCKIKQLLFLWLLFWGFFQYLSPPFPTEGCCLSKRGNIQIAKEMMCFEHSRSGVVKQGAIVLFGWEQPGVSLLWKVNIIRELQSPLHLWREIPDSVFGFWGRKN